MTIYQKHYIFGMQPALSCKIEAFYTTAGLYQVGDGVDARFEFEFVELQPVWNEAGCIGCHRQKTMVD